MKSTVVHALSFIGKRSVKTSGELARMLDVSQQTASRWLVQLRGEKLVEKQGGKYCITVNGRATLEFLVQSKLVFTGRVFTGIGEGKYYLTREGYVRQFGKLGFKPFPGTLNLRLSEEQAAANLLLRKSRGIVLNGFKEKERSFGDVVCHPALFEGLKGAVIVPVRAHYDSTVLELAAPFNLRKKLGVKDGDEVSVEVLSV